MKNIITQLERQGIPVTQLKSVNTAQIPTKTRAEIVLNIKEPIDLVFTIGAGVEITIIEHWQPGVKSSKVLLNLGTESKVDYLIDGAKYVSPEIDYQVYLNRDTNFNLYSYFDTNKNFAGQMILHHQKHGSTGNIVSGLNLSGNGQSKLKFINHHVSQHTSGNVFLKCLGQDNVYTEINGLIKIDPQAQFTNSYLTENVLLLSKNAEVKANPNLEILNNEVKASHSATVSRLDEQMIYYLTSRGLTENQAKKLLIKGFFSSLLNTASNKIIYERLQKRLSLA